MIYPSPFRLRRKLGKTSCLLVLLQQVKIFRRLSTYMRHSTFRALSISGIDPCNTCLKITQDLKQHQNRFGVTHLGISRRLKNCTVTNFRISSTQWEQTVGSTNPGNTFLGHLVAHWHRDTFRIAAVSAVKFSHIKVSLWAYRFECNVIAYGLVDNFLALDNCVGCDFVSLYQGLF